MADLQALINSSVTDISIPIIRVPAWDMYVGDFRAGIPLLRSANIAINLRDGEIFLSSILHALSTKSLPVALADQVRALDAELHSRLDSPYHVVSWLLDKDSFDLAHAGLLQYLGWTVLTHYLRPLVNAFALWRKEDNWLRGYCPTCGALPAMAHLVGVDPGRVRFLLCGCCATRWRYGRTRCPFCGTAEDQPLSVLAVEGEKHFRIDYCVSCKGYLKTYNGEGSEDLMLADWSSIHLDLIALDRGLKRFAQSLYRL
jgi:FdhE protein